MALDASTAALNFRRRYIEGLLFRAVPAVLFAVTLTVCASWNLVISWQNLVPVLWILGAIVAINIPYWYLGQWSGFPLWQFYLHWTGDLVAITLVVYFLGGADVPMVQFTYIMMIVTAALFVSRRSAFVLATGATLAYGALGIAEIMQWIDHRGGLWAHTYSSETRVFVIVISGVFFYWLAYLSGTLSELLRRANEELASTRAVIAEQNRLLEQRVRERTRDLEERTDELEELVYAVTHDLQNVAVASTETARKLIEFDGPQLSTRGQRYADRLVRDCRAMAQMLRDLLAAVSQSEVTERRELVDVNAIVREAIARAQGAVETKNIDIAVRPLPAMHADQQKIHHVFENLLSNACKYVGDKPEPRIEIGGAEHDGTIDYWVRDNGVGVEPSQVGRIFQLYHRAPNQTVAGVEQQGHGIGLAVVKRIVQRYGGRIWVESTPGEGATFHLSFPRDEERSDA